MSLLQRFLEAVQAIKASKPKYQRTGDGSNGLCDCIGLIIGALRRLGLSWTGIHGSNYAARKQTVGLKKIGSVSELKVGDIVYKAYDPDHKKWDLPKRYQKGGAYYNGDLKDYYHVGVVTHVNPLEITHMTTPTVKVDTRLNQNTSSVWRYYGRVKALANEGAEPIQTQIEIPVKEPLATSGAVAIVNAPSGLFVKMRQNPSTSCRMWENVPVGAKVTLVEPGEEWAKINYGRYKGWYMMAKFLDVQEGGKAA